MSSKARIKFDFLKKKLSIGVVLKDPVKAEYSGKEKRKTLILAFEVILTNFFTLFWPLCNKLFRLSKIPMN